MKISNAFIWASVCAAILLISISCSNWSRKAPAFSNETPGTIALNDTLFCDVTEATNFHWMEYLYWLSREFGDDSPEYLDALPKSDVWDEYLCLEGFRDNYLRHPAFRDYPLVGVTKNQAELYSKWRSDRVFEYYLIKNKYMDYNYPDSISAGSNYFTIEGYFDGTFKPRYLKTDPDKVFIRDTSLLYPTYRLPSNLDRKIILDYLDSTDYRFASSYAKKEQEWINSQSVHVYLEIEPCDSNILLVEPVIYVGHGYPEMRKIKFLYNVRGNVAEWSSDQNITYGGGWPHTRAYVYKHDTISCDDPNAWTGFRNVCTWRKFDF